MMVDHHGTDLFLVNDQTFNFGFRPRTQTPGDELVELWRRVLWAAENAPACPCHGLVSGRFNPDAIETNMLTPMRTRFRDEGKQGLAEYLGRRLTKSPFAGLRQPLEKWLKGLDEAKLDPDSRKLLGDELAAMMKYYAEEQPAFVCE